MRAAIGSIALATVAAATACTAGATPCVVMLGAWGPEMPDLEMMVGDTARSDLRDHFGPRNCMEDIPAGWKFWELRSSDSAAVAVSVSAEHVLETIALEVADSVLVSAHLTVFDEFPDEEFHEFVVRVRPRPGG